MGSWRCWSHRAGLAGDDPQKKREVIGRNGFVIEVEGCKAPVEALHGRGVDILDGPMEMPWGISTVIADLYGNTHHVQEPKPLEW